MQACNQCEILYIQGIRCHETGCPDSWKDVKRECNWCGQEFIPEDKNYMSCSEECDRCYHN